MKVPTIKEILEDLKNQGLSDTLAMDYGVTIALMDQESKTAGKVFINNILIALRIYQKKCLSSDKQIDNFNQTISEYILK